MNDFTKGIATELAVLQESCKKYTINALTKPINYDEGKTAWMEAARSGHYTNPQWSYDTPKLYGATNSIDELAVSRDHLDKMLAADSPSDIFVRELIYRAYERQMQVCLAANRIAERRDGDTSLSLADYFGPLNQELIDLAYRIESGDTRFFDDATADVQCAKSVEEIEKLKSTLWTSYGLADLVRKAIDTYGLSDTWVCEIHAKNLCSAINVTGKKPGIFIPENYSAQKNSIEAAMMVGHECTHMLHYANCIELLVREFNIPYDVARIVVARQPSVLTEGFAKLNDARVKKFYTGTNEGAAHPYYVIAADIASKGGSFADIAAYIYPRRIAAGYSIDETLEFVWKACYRTFRGCHNTENPRCFVNTDAKSYLEGNVQAIKLEKTAPIMSSYAKLSLSDIDRASSILGAEIPVYYQHRHIAETLF